MKRVVLESPFAGNIEEVEKNIEYARKCVRDCLLKGEAPIASHLLYTQPRILDDKIPEERALGIEAGLVWGECAEETVVYLDRGLSGGMKYGIGCAEGVGRSVFYRTLHQIKIVTITGPSGAGKTSIVKELLKFWPEMSLVMSVTTRSSRESDLPGEYRYNTPQRVFENKGRFLWSTSVHGDTYGTLKKSVHEALVKSTPSAMILVPWVVGALREYAFLKSEGSVLSFYLLPPPEDRLCERLRVRGETAAAIVRRIADCKRWEEEVRMSGIPYIFVLNEHTSPPEIGIIKAARKILAYLGR